MASEIHAFSLASRAWVFGTALRRAAEIPSSVLGVIVGRRRSRLCFPSYLECYLRGALQSKRLLLYRGNNLSQDVLYMFRK